MKKWGKNPALKKGDLKMTKKESIKKHIEFIEFEKREIRSFLPMSYHLNLNLQVKYLEMFGCYIVSSRVKKDLKLFRTLENEAVEADLSFMSCKEIEKEMLKSIQTKQNTLKEIALKKEWQPVPKTQNRKVNLKEEVAFKFARLERYKTLIKTYLTMSDEEIQQINL